MQLGSFIWLARRWWLTVVLATLVGALAGFLLAGAMAGSYRAQSRVLVGPLNASFDIIRASTELTRTYAFLATSAQVVDEAIANSGLALEQRQLAGAIDATANQEARIITIEVTLSDADQAAAAANALAQTLAAITERESERPEGQVTILNAAGTLVTEPGASRAVLAVLAGLVGLLAAVLLAAVVELLDDRLRDVAAVRSIARAQFLGSYPIPRRGRLSPRTAARQRRRYERLVGDLLARDDHPIQVVLVVSSGAASDAVQVTSMLAAAARDVGIPVELIDADPPMTTQAGRAGAGPTGLTWLERQAGGALRDDPDRSLRGPAAVTTAGEAVYDPGSVDALRRALPAGTLALVDGGAAAESFRAALWARVADAIVIVAQVDRDSRDDLKDALERVAAAAHATTWVIAVTPQGDPRLGWRRGSTAASDNPTVPEAVVPPATRRPPEAAATSGNARYGEIDRPPSPSVRGGLAEEAE